MPQKHKKQGHLHLQIPQGTETFHLEEAYRHRRMVAHIEDMMSRWGYLPVETPVFDFYDTYRPLLNRKAQEKVYRLIDREGELLMLRSDITLFLARQMSLLIKESALPIRVCYADSILRHEDAEDISRNEFYQMGAELIGKPGRPGDREIILLAAETFRALGLDNTVFHLGSRKLFDLLTALAGAEQTEKLQEAIRLRDREAFAQLLSSLDPALRGQLEELIFFIGTREEAQALIDQSILPEEFKAPAEELLALGEDLLAAEPELPLRFDFTEIGEQPYYTGMVFCAYTPGVATASASGGRYDQLLGALGTPAPSVGFSLLLRKIEPLTEENSRFAPPQAEKTAPASFAEAYRAAQKLRKTGKAVLLEDEEGNRND